MNHIWFIWAGLALAVLFGGWGGTIAVGYIHLISWIDTDVYHNTCNYTECPLKYDFTKYSAHALAIISSIVIAGLILKLLERFKIFDTKITTNETLK